ncbi:hypothetical protein L249_1754 [Ophiocordyceps polyrhachis-furcata BCC 54312]|uniref:Chromosome segregation in meiosis protein n=1 Tax=Ophiocordyceps polyrhachis-furcata BCC 54312 TaxID=1330021 RepID=A0A367LR66_9HYPO|nr:hypothetical protein L249_1754 [Ophiocordyceps polyrhachis-furcata BCC 54312]
MSTAVAPPPPLGDLDDYDVNDSDDPFRSPSPSPATKRKAAAGGLGLDEEVSVQKRTRVPNIKLDEGRLLGPEGIPRLKERVGKLRIKGKGHEFADGERLLALYQFWLDDLFPKAKFLDALVMVERAGHRKALLQARNRWIDEGKPKDRQDEDDVDNGVNHDRESHESQPPTQENTSPATPRPKTPERNDVPDDDDLYDATPRAPTRSANDLDALMQETLNAEPDEDDLDALIAEAGVSDRIGAHDGVGPRDESGHFSDDEAAMAAV